MKGLILSGGKGTRLYPLTYTRAKQLIPVANKPVLVRVIEAIRSAGVEEIGIVVGETAPEIQEALGDGQPWDVKLTYIPQDSPDGLAHAVKISRPFLQDEPFVMFLGDNVIQGGIGELIRSFAASTWNSQIVLKEVANPSAYGVAKLRPDGSIEQLIEKPKDPPSNLALVGIYMFDHHVFEAVEAIKPSKRGELEITDAIQWLVEHGYQVYPHIHQGWWIDTGKPTDMLEANAHVLEEVVPSIDPSAQIDEHSQVDRRVTVQAGARIVRSVVRGPAIIGMNALIEDAYIGPFTSIYHDVSVRDAQIERCIILEKSEVSGLGRGMILRDSLIGRQARVGRSSELPMGVKLNLGDHSNILI